MGVDDTTVYNDEDIKRNTKVEVRRGELTYFASSNTREYRGNKYTRRSFYSVFFVRVHGGGWKRSKGSFWNVSRSIFFSTF